jgi:transaldolase
VQRPLWGSTSTKNPVYSDVRYVEELIGPNTVNTMPHATLEAFMDHGEVALTLTQDVEAARATLSRLEAIGLNLTQMTDDLQAQGVAAFAASFDNLLQAIEEKRRQFVPQ